MVVESVAPERGARVPDAGWRRRYRAHLAVLATAQKSPVGTPAYSRRINRAMARRVAAAGAVAGLSPNVATALSALLSALGLALLFTAEPSLPMGLAVAVLLAAGYVMDSVDGQLARLRGVGSLSGEWLDHTVDCVKTCLLHLAVLVSFYRWPPEPDELGRGVVLLVPMVFLVADITLYFGILTLPHLRARTASTALSRTTEGPLREWLVLPNDYGLICWTFVLLAWPPVFLAAYALLAAANLAFLALAWAKWWCELRALDRQER